MRRGGDGETVPLNSMLSNYIGLEDPAAGGLAAAWSRGRSEAQWAMCKGAGTSSKNNDTSATPVSDLFRGGIP
jgi:hypothetical protein